MLKRTSIITGGNRGIGRAIAEGFARDGFDIGIIARDSDEISNTVNDLTEKYPDSKIKGYICDICNKEQVEAVFNEIKKEFKQIDVLINNAGANSRKKISSYSIEDWHLEIETNLTGTFNCSMAAYQHMKEQSIGHIVNFSSIKGKEATSSVGYGASKSGIIGLTKSLAKQFIKQNIYVNCIAPGFINTGMTKLLSSDELNEYLKMIPIGRVGELEEIYSVIRFLTSKDSSYIVGSTIDVNGGYLMD